MRFDRATIALVPRTTSNCLDLAVRFSGRHAAVLLSLWMLIAIPSSTVVFLLTRYLETTMLTAIAVTFFASSVLGFLLITGTAPSAFGEPFVFRKVLKRIRFREFKQIVVGLLLRLAIAAGLCVFIVPGYWIAVQNSFHAEQSALSQLVGHVQDRRVGELVRTHLPDLLFRSGLVCGFTFLLWIVVFVTVDAAAGLVFGFPILLGRGGDFSSGDAVFSDVGYYVFSDPRVLTTMTATALLVYTFGRLAWFFCYIDLRVRLDLWDMELLFLQQTARLEVPE